MFNFLKQNIAPILLATLPPPLWHKLLGIELIIPHWHIVSDELLPHISGLYKYRNTKQFKTDLDFFLKFYKPVSLQSIINHLDGIERLPQRCFLPTFDDGFREIYDIVAPILLAKGVPAAFFIISSNINNQTLCYPQKKSIIINMVNKLNNTNIKTQLIKLLDSSGVRGQNLTSKLSNIYYLKRNILDEVAIILNCDFVKYVDTVQPYLSIAQIKYLLKKGFDIGAHSIDHPLYSELSIEEQVAQTVESIRQLSKTFEFSCNAFAFPYSDADISLDFFQRAFVEKQLKVTFGIGSISSNSFPRNLPRFTMERTDRPAKQILARQFGRTLLRMY
jgi:peptidoglycan/xylan/chitin deacetylase (PgdA/CDA1 family)